MRTEALLGMLALQHNDLGSGHAHLHRYLTMVTQSRFHDERSWPSNLTEIEVEERRRLVSESFSKGHSVAHQQCLMITQLVLAVLPV